MAGSYADAPSRRMAFDADGTVGTRTLAGGGRTDMLTAGQLADLNDESSSAVSTDQSNAAIHWALIFPELREVDGLFLTGVQSGGVDNLTTVESSADTTNGVDGSWATIFADYADPSGTAVTPFYRSEIRSAATSGARAVRALQPAGGGNTPSLRAFHVYGEISPGETPDRLLFLDELTGLEFTLPIDFGDVPRGGSEDVELRLRNNSATLTASNIQYTAEAITTGDTSGGWYTFTLPGGATFQSTQQIASLAAATTTGIITMRRITPGAAPVGLYAGRIRATTQTWS